MFSRRAFLPSFLVALALLFAGCDGGKKASTALKSVEDRFAIKLGERTVQAQIALEPGEMEKGLMFRKAMGEEEGMIFVFDRPQLMSFWMRNTLIPLDIGYFDSDGTLREVYKMYPNDESPVKSMSARQIVLEMNQGWYARAQIRPGAKLDLTALKAAIRARGMDPVRLGLN